MALQVKVLTLLDGHLVLQALTLQMPILFLLILRVSCI